MAKQFRTAGRIARVWESLLDACFPKSGAAAEIEALDAADARSLLPPASRTAHFDGISPLFDYRDERVRALVWEIKFRGNRRLAETAAGMLAEEILDEVSRLRMFETPLPPLIVPIPASKERRRERGFNQTEVLARSVWRSGLSSSTVYAPNVIAKLRHTPPQTELGREARLSNLSGCFAVTNPFFVSGRHVILIDDVVTTGATIAEARRALLEAGAKEVVAFTIAH